MAAIPKKTRRHVSKPTLENLPINRKNLELLALAIMALCALSILLMPFGFKKTLRFDKGKIVYVGQVRNNKMNGQGTLTYKNGDRYDGHFVDGQFEGEGTFKSKSGWTYKGSFHKGQADGKGTLTTADGKTYKGRFKQGIYQK